MFKILSWFALGRSGKWSSFRKAFIAKHPTCEACGSCKYLTVHHVIPVSVDDTKEFDEDNCIVLCKTCHFVFGHLHLYSSWNPDVRKDCENHLLKVRSRPCRQKG